MNLTDTVIQQRFADGEVIISEGIMSNNAYVVLSGKVRVTKKYDNKTIAIETLGEGDIFGEMGLIGHSVRSASVVALGDVTVGLIDKESFDRLLDSLPFDVRTILSSLVHRLRGTTDMLARLGSELEDVRRKLMTR